MLSFGSNSMLDRVAHHTLVRLVYESAVDPRRWRIFLSKWAKTTQAHAAALVVHDLQNHAGAILVGHGLAASWKRRYEEYYAGLNTWTERAGHLWRPDCAARFGDVLRDRVSHPAEWLIWRGRIRADAPTHAAR